MNRQKGHHYDEDMSSSSSSKVIVVAVKASKDISRTALVWALTHVVQPGDCIKLLVIIPALSSRKKVWGFSRFTTDCATNHWTSRLGTVSDQKEDITNSCSQLVLQLHDFYDPEKIKIRVKILSGSLCGAVAAEAKRVQSSWVVLDRKLKGEKKYCMEELHCNIVIMKHSHPKILRLNLNSSPKKELGRDCAFSLEPNAYITNLKDNFEHSDIIKGPAVTPASSPEQGSPPLTVTDIGTASISSSDPGTSPFFHSDNYDRRRRCFPFVVHEGLTNLEDIVSDSESEKLSSSSKSSSFQPWISNVICVDGEFSKHEENIKRSSDKSLVSTYESLLQKLTMLDQDHIYGMPTCKIDVNLSKSVREVISLSRNAPHGPPPLCSICNHKAPAFGNPPRWFTFAELQLATGGFSQANFLAEGRMQNVLDWSARQKIAVGAARGLRYLHEECRVGCIVHRDLRPNNILLTHDFEALVGDFGLARWQPDGDMGVETRARPLLEEQAIHKLVDPSIGNCYVDQEVYRMMQCSSMCIRRDPHLRPRVSQVLKMLEGDILM
ncbi:hypothetical protein TSUD_75360 [Trifolium subterraneum]|nr:hypothetical protein TSUD_75360 [Trifolium subterraneum]